MVILAYKFVERRHCRGRCARCGVPGRRRDVGVEVGAVAVDLQAADDCVASWIAVGVRAVCPSAA